MLEEKSMKKVCFCIPYFGQWPAWIDLFIRSCSYNQCVDFLILHDRELPVKSIPSNIILKKFSIEQFKLCAENLLGFKLKNFIDNHKVCDFKPFYGLMFKSHLKDYEYWGYCDVDVMFGDLSKVINPTFLHEVDVFSAHESKIVGHFTILKNVDTVNNLCFQIDGYRERFWEPHITFMDEGSFAIVLYNNPHIKWKKVNPIKEGLKQEFMDHNITYRYDGSVADFDSHLTNYTVWQNGRVFFSVDKIKVEILYVHFMGLKKEIFWRNLDQVLEDNTCYFSAIGVDNQLFDQRKLQYKTLKIMIRINLYLRQLLGKIVGAKLRRKIGLFIKKMKEK